MRRRIDHLKITFIGKTSKLVTRLLIFSNDLGWIMWSVLAFSQAYDTATIVLSGACGKLNIPMPR